ncbi:C40 family peptidase [Brevibacterium renqingii]|uniref:C40 family peptidase n=1 Tax=Brevibacterium renqingii TaxID=2776916 RepID=UPI001AE06738
MARKQHGRRAAETKVKTPLTELLDANSGAFGRRAAVVAASGGLLTAAVLPATGQTADDTASVSAESDDHAQVEFKNQTPTIQAGSGSEESDQGGAATVDVDVITAEGAPKPKPKPKPEPKPATESPAQTQSSSSETSDEDSSESSDEDSAKAETADDKASDDTGSSDETPKKDSGDSDSSGPIDGSKAEQVIGWAKKGVGTPYVYGGTSQSGWDCSGYTSWVYSHVGVDLPRQSGAQKTSGTVVSQAEAKPGDLIWHPGHVGIYAGGGQMYDAGSPGSGTSKRSFSWMGDVTFIRVL